MYGFFIHTGNRLEELAAELAGMLHRPPGSAAGSGAAGILEPEVIVVPGRGVESWLKLYLARENGIAANLDCPFPQTFIEERVLPPLRRALAGDGDAAGDDPWSPELLTWRIFFILASAVKDNEEPLAAAVRYLKTAADELSAWQLSASLVGLFQRYLNSRPELIRAWERGSNPLSELPASTWQMHLWRRLRDGLAAPHFAALHELFNQLLYPEYFPPPEPAGVLDLDGIRAGLPRRLILFGFSSLPPVYLDIFFALGRLSEVHLFYCNPCSDYWGDQYRLGSLQPGIGPGGVLHPLLAAWGRQGRHFFETVATLEVDSYSENFVPATGNSLLARLQNQILRLELPGERNELEAGDDSLQIHRCHTRRREVEVIYDAILAALDRNPDLTCEDIFILAPDIELYAPYIEALFGGADRPVRVSGRPPLPCNLVSGRRRLKLPVIAAFIGILRLLPGRTPAGEVFDIFCSEVVCRRFGVEPEALGRLFSWLGKAGVSWGLDADFRRRATGTAFAENSFCWGLERLLAGYALAGNGLREDFPGASVALWPGSDSPAGDLLPLPGIEGDDALVLGGFCDFIEKLRQAARRLAGPLPAAAWRVELEKLLAAFIRPEEVDDEGYDALLRSLENLGRNLAAAGPESSGAAISLATVIAVLEDELAAGGGGRGFFRGGIDCASLLSLKGVPAKMICILGLNDGEFPRGDRPPAYDLIAARPRPGDRTARDEDRFLFLESLLAARRILVLSYLGRDPGDNHPLPASVLVNELLEFVEDNFRPPRDSPARSLGRYLVREHPPQPFSRSCFPVVDDPGNGDHGFSYDQAAARAAAAFGQPSREPPDFLRIALPGIAETSVELDELVRFFRNPAAWFLRERLAFSPLRSAPEEFPESEPFVPDSLDLYSLGRGLVEHLLRDQDAAGRAPAAVCESLYRRYAAAGLLPLGSPGRSVFRRCFQAAATLVERLRPCCATSLPPLSGCYRLPGGGDSGIEIDCCLDHLYRDGKGRTRQVLFRPARNPNDKDRVETAVRHLGLELLGPDEECETRFFSLDSELVRRRCDSAAARAELETLAALFREGGTRPLPFMPELSLEWYRRHRQALKKGEAQPPAPLAARKAVYGKLERPGDYDFAARDEHFRYCFATAWDRDEFWEEFSRLSLILGPIFADPEF